MGIQPEQSPEKDWEWKGGGTPEFGKGAWHNPTTKESLHPDFDHPGNVKPHWDYVGPNKEKARLYTDGSYKWKNGE